MKKLIVLLTVLSLLTVGLLTGCGAKARRFSEGHRCTAHRGRVRVRVDKNQPELLEEVNKFIAKIKSDGTYDKILNKYFGDGTPTPVTSAELDPSKNSSW